MKLFPAIQALCAVASGLNSKLIIGNSLANNAVKSDRILMNSKRFE